MNPLRATERRVALGVSSVIVVALWAMVRGGYVHLAPLAVDGLVQRLTPLFVAALFIERAVEIVLTPWRAKTAALLKLARDRADPATRATHELTLAEYQSTSQRLALWLAFGMGGLVSVAGLRGLGSFVALQAASPGSGPIPQTRFFVILDVLLTGTVLGGGADGIHKMVSVITDFLDHTRRQMNGSAGSAPVPTPTPARGPAAPATAPQAAGGHIHDPGA